jgi:hypothetical protein
MALIRLNSQSAPANTFGGGGKILQVVSNEDSTTSSWTGWGDVISQSITPSSTSSKILIQFTGMFGLDYRYFAGRLFRGTTQIAKGDADGNRSPVFFNMFYNQDISNQGYNAETICASYLDSPTTTSAITYKVDAGNINSGNNGLGGTRTMYMNRPQYDGNSDYFARGTTTLTLIEIDGSS